MKLMRVGVGTDEDHIYHAGHAFVCVSDDALWLLRGPGKRWRVRVEGEG